MPYKSNSTNKQSKSHTGDPAGRGQSKAGFKTVDETALDARHEEIRNKYTEGPDEIPSHLKMHPNRNTNKPDIDKPAYS